jgi:hypothetical protein
MQKRKISDVLSSADKLKEICQCLHKVEAGNRKKEITRGLKVN